MIDLKFVLFYAGSKMSYLRYLCFKTLRHFHPNASIKIFTTEENTSTGHYWGSERQDFEKNIEGKDYKEDLKDLDVEIIVLKNFAAQYNPVVQSDIFRYWYLKNNGGFYLDTDQIILKSFETLPLNKDLICSVYFNSDCGTYAPVGVLGSEKNTKIMQYISENILNYYNNSNYNSSGPFMFIKVLNELQINFGSDKYVNTPSHYFYPVNRSGNVNLIYEGKLDLLPSSYALHWFGGHPLSQSFNLKYTEEFAKESQDTISKFLRKESLL